MSDAPNVDPRRADRVAAAAAMAIARLAMGQDDGTDADHFAAIGESLCWITAPADTLSKTDARRQDPRIRGLCSARNRVTHGGVVAAPAGLDLAYSAILGEAVLGQMRRGGTEEYVWVGRDEIPLGPDDESSTTQAEAYDIAITGQTVVESHREALPLLEGAASN
jgi:hypothetical protein